MQILQIQYYFLLNHFLVFLKHLQLQPEQKTWCYETVHWVLIISSGHQMMDEQEENCQVCGFVCQYCKCIHLDHVWCTDPNLHILILKYFVSITEIEKKNFNVIRAESISLTCWKLFFKRDAYIEDDLIIYHYINIAFYSSADVES